MRRKDLLFMFIAFNTMLSANNLFAQERYHGGAGDGYASAWISPPNALQIAESATWELIHCEQEQFCVFPPKSAGEYVIEILDLRGVVLLKIVQNKGNQRFTFSAKGVYMLRITHALGIYCKKISQ